MARGPLEAVSASVTNNIQTKKVVCRDHMEHKLVYAYLSFSLTAVDHKFSTSQFSETRLPHTRSLFHCYSFAVLLRFCTLWLRITFASRFGIRGTVKRAAVNFRINHFSPVIHRNHGRHLTSRRGSLSSRLGVISAVNVAYLTLRKDLKS